MTTKPLGVAIAIGNQKGGVAKTSNTVNIAAALAERGLKCLIIDLDPSAGSTKHFKLAEKSYAGTFELFVRENPDPLELAVTEGLPRNVSIIPSRTELHELPKHISKFADPQTVLAKAIAPARAVFDVILLDTPPTPAFITTVAAYLVADWILLSSFPDTLSLYGLNEALADIADVRNSRNPNLELLGIIISAVDRRTVAWRDIEDLIRKNFPTRAFSTVISRAQAVQTACERGKTLFQIRQYKNHAVTGQYRQLAAEIHSRIANREKFLADEKVPAFEPAAADTQNFETAQPSPLVANA